MFEIPGNLPPCLKFAISNLLLPSLCTYDLYLFFKTWIKRMSLRGDDAKDWFYKGEGAANLVLGYCGSSPILIGKVLRIQKVENRKNLSADGCLVLSNHEKLLWENISELVESTSKDLAARAFVQHVMSNLLNSKHIDAGILVPVTVEFLEAVERNITNQRPS
ncbi:inositol-pentakisphosphate 2-kinase IPK1-like [Canna indica]|uniref:Inositol-pentakisphosphate 2-kinase n=1 Tax=Canna indica TaxID=4628 RepID=A0AAQ3K0Y5_9LILI|nr:inositol-pentakisphosphate 2-kinase IPK1-like [Canna indica]